MRKLVVTALVLALLGVFANSMVMAIAPFDKEFKKLYIEPNKESAFAKALGMPSCNACHDPKNKKIRNEYGMAVSKLLKKADYSGEKIAGDPEGKAKEIVEALKKVEAEKAKDGKTFGERIKAGLVPSSS